MNLFTAGIVVKLRISVIARRIKIHSSIIVIKLEYVCDIKNKGIYENVLKIS